MSGREVHEKRGEKGKRRQMHIDSSQVEASLNPVRGVRDALRRQGIEPRDYAKQNRKAIRQASQNNALRKERSWIGSVDDIPSRTRRRSSAVPRAISEEDAKNNYILRNILEAGSKSRCAIPSSQESASTPWTSKDGYGQMRKVEMAQEQEARERAKEASLCPAGMRIMDAVEQREAVEKITRHKTSVETELQNLPLLIETPSLMKLKTDLERRLTELEEAERIFSRPKVIVKS